MCPAGWIELGAHRPGVHEFLLVSILDWEQGGEWWRGDLRVVGREPAYLTVFSTSALATLDCSLQQPQWSFTYTQITTFLLKFYCLPICLIEAKRILRYSSPLFLSVSSSSTPPFLTFFWPHWVSLQCLINSRHIPTSSLPGLLSSDWSILSQMCTDWVPSHHHLWNYWNVISEVFWPSYLKLQFPLSNT